MLRAQEDGGGGDALQARPGIDKDQWVSDRAGGAGDPEVQGIRANPAAGTAPFRGCGHADPREGRGSHIADLCHQAEHREGPGGLLPEVRGRAEQEGDQRYPRPLRPHPPRRRPSPLRAQEVRWSRRQGQVPEILPLISYALLFYEYPCLAVFFF